MTRKEYNSKYVLYGDGHVLDCVERLRSLLDNLGFEVSVSLYDMMLSNHVEPIQAAIEESTDATLKDIDYESFHKAVESLEDTVMAEAKTRMIAVPTARRVPLRQLYGRAESTSSFRRSCAPQ